MTGRAGWALACLAAWTVLAALVGCLAWPCWYRRRQRRATRCAARDYRAARQRQAAPGRRTGPAGPDPGGHVTPLNNNSRTSTGPPGRPRR